MRISYTVRSRVGDRVPGSSPVVRTSSTPRCRRLACVGAGGDDALNPLLDRQVSRMHLVRTEDIDIAEIKMIGRHIDRDVFSSLISDLQLHLMSDKTEA